MTTRQFFVWSGWAILFTLAIPVLQWGAGDLPSYLVVEEGDLPASYSIAREDLPWQIYPDISQTSSATYDRIVVNRDGPSSGQRWGHIVTVSYTNATTADRAYVAIRREAEIKGNAQSLPFGERGSQSAPTPQFGSSDILFQRCGVIVHVTLQGDGVLDLLLAYARRLDERIAAARCKK